MINSTRWAFRWTSINLNFPNNLSHFLSLTQNGSTSRTSRVWQNYIAAGTCWEDRHWFKGLSASVVYEWDIQLKTWLPSSYKLQSQQSLDFLLFFVSFCPCPSPFSIHSWSCFRINIFSFSIITSPYWSFILFFWFNLPMKNLQYLNRYQEKSLIVVMNFTSSSRKGQVLI